MLSYYEILQVDKDASDAEIKKAYRKLCKILHPDLHDNTRESNVIFNLLHEAYETLSNPTKRRNYNPNHQNSNSFDISSEKYEELLSGYKKIVKDYEKILKSKNQRERELLEQIRVLKNQKKQNSQAQKIDTKDTNKPNNQKNKAKSEKPEQHSTLGIILLVLFWVVVVGIIVLILTIPAGWWFIIGLVGLPIYFFISAFRKL